MRHPVIYLLIAAAVLAVSTAQAEKLYKWVGKDGKVSYQDRPPPADADVVQERDLSVRRTGSSAGTDEASDAAQNFPVVLYTVPNCSPCDEARTYLKKRRIPFSEKNVGNNPVLQKEMIAKVGQLSVPTITVGSKVMNGYVRSLLAGELDQAGYPKEGKAEGKAEGEEEGGQANEQEVVPEENTTP
jgi:glutaredoxin